MQRGHYFLGSSRCRFDNALFLTFGTGADVALRRLVDIERCFTESAAFCGEWRRHATVRAQPILVGQVTHG
jgi:hypothetical protein